MGIVGDIFLFVAGLGVDSDLRLGMVNSEMIYKCVTSNNFNSGLTLVYVFTHRTHKTLSSTLYTFSVS